MHLCVDYRRLNDVTIPDPFYMPTLDEVVSAISENNVISKLDLTKGYYQVEVAEEDRTKTAFVCPFGKFEFTRTPFRLRNAPAVFQRLMDTVLKDCYEFSRAYLDDIVISSKEWESHLGHVQKVLAQLKKG